jgi:polar amino acid transport system substrate-binding protein
MKRLAILLAAPLACAAAMAQTVTLHYHPRPPYVVVVNGVLTGLTGAPALAAFQSTGAPFVVLETPASRFMQLLEKNAGLDCGVGWYKNPAREAIGKFTKPLYQGRPLAALTLASNDRLRTNDTIEALLTNDNLVLLVKQSYTYGSVLYAMLEKFQPRHEKTTGENVQMVQMLAAKRADYMLSAPEEAQASIEAAGLSPSAFKLVALKNMPNGERRHILCSNNVPDDFIAKLNAAIK